MNGRTNGRTDGISPPFYKTSSPTGAAAQKAEGPSVGLWRASERAGRVLEAAWRAYDRAGRASVIEHLKWYCRLSSQNNDKMYKPKRV